MVSTVSAESGRPDRVAGLPDNRALDTGIAALTVALLLVSLGGVFRMHISQAVTLVLLIITFGGIYSFGALQMRRWNAIARVLWMLALTAVWVAAMFLTPVAVYWVFILFFLFMRAFNGWYGVVGVVGVLAISILVQIPDGLTLGGVMGPTVSALVVIMITYAFKVIARVSAEREALIQELVDTQEALALKEREAGVVQERQRLAHEIHDTVAQLSLIHI